jgi:hypothetical protein
VNSTPDRSTSRSASYSDALYAPPPAPIARYLLVRSVDVPAMDQRPHTPAA